MNGFNLSNISDLYVGGTQASAAYYGSSLIWQAVQPHDYSQDYFTIKSLEDNNIIKLYAGNNSWVPNVEYSTNGGTSWTSTRPNTSGNSIATLNTGDTILIRATTSAWYMNSYANRIIPSKTHKIYGNIMSLTYGDNFSNQTSLKGANAFRRLFYNNTKLTDASNLILPATTLTNYCYHQMFYGCTLLTSPPALPATTLSDYCYDSMFQGCTSLLTAPELPATTLPEYCCYYMMFKDCTSLTTAPKLPAHTLTLSCYEEMFNGCSSLNYIKCLATSINAANCIHNWVTGVSVTGTFIKNYVNYPSGNSGIPSGWTVYIASA